jgi:RNA polymerase sigma-70 factor (ECF subfamily)
LSNKTESPVSEPFDSPAKDVELVERCRRGEAAAFDQLVERYQRRVIGLCYRHLHNYEEACDLAQEIFVQAFQHLAGFEGKSSFSTWLYRISLNACYNRQRWHKAKGRGGVTSLEGLLERREANPDSSVLLKDRARGALEQLERGEEIQQLRSALESLDESQRRVVELVDIEELSYDEAARVLQVPVNTVRSRLSRARRQLKQKLVRLRKRLGGLRAQEDQ